MYIKLFIQKKEIHIRDTKTGKAVLQILCSTTSFEDTRFRAGNKTKAIIDNTSTKDDTEHENRDSFKEESDETFFD